MEVSRRTRPTQRRATRQQTVWPSVLMTEARNLDSAGKFLNFIFWSDGKELKVFKTSWGQIYIYIVYIFIYIYIYIFFNVFRTWLIWTQAFNLWKRQEVKSRRKPKPCVRILSRPRYPDPKMRQNSRWKTSTFPGTSCVSAQWSVSFGIWQTPCPCVWMDYYAPWGLNAKIAGCSLKKTSTFCRLRAFFFLLTFHQ